MPCPICFEDEEAVSSLHTLSCGHAACKECLRYWLSEEERTGQTAGTCPIETCRMAVSAADTLVILERAFRPAGLNKKRSLSLSSFSSSPVNNNHNSKDDDRSKKPREGEDESSSAWLEENTMKCGGCEGYIMKESGCDKLQCICGYRVCWRCRTVKAACNCNPNHGFVDNVTGRPSFRPQEVATKEELSDMKSYLEKRRSKPTSPMFFPPTFGNDFIDAFFGSNDVWGGLPFGTSQESPLLHGRQFPFFHATSTRDPTTTRAEAVAAAASLRERFSFSTTTTIQLESRSMLQVAPISFVSSLPPTTMTTTTTTTTTRPANLSTQRKSKIIQCIIQDDISLAVEMYRKEMEACGGSAPSWAKELAFYLRRHDSDTVRSLFPGVSG